MNQPDKSILDFLSQYDEKVKIHTLKVRELLLNHFPGIGEVLDMPAKMVAYTYGPKYADMVCVIIPSKKGLKLGFSYGSRLEDPHKLLQGTGKISRYVEIKSEEQLKTPELIELLNEALKFYKEMKK